LGGQTYMFVFETAIFHSCSDEELKRPLRPFATNIIKAKAIHTFSNG